ncbi:MAG TPA: hypothetical protein PLY87_16460 [Planctomycetaceae bacterium]|nr:hypothetical protein [Planctomycetaceae bacterium]
MPASLTRNEYYWTNDRLVHEVNQRANVYSGWRLRRSQRDLVATIEDRGTSKKIEHGPAATSTRTAHALLRDERLQVDPNTQDIGADVPEELVRRGSAIVQDAVAEVTRQYSRLSNEERRTGALQYDLNRVGVIEQDGWQLTIILQGFASNPKENITGADLGIVVDLKHGGKQVSKGFWVQAKQTDSMPKEPLTLKDLKGQMADMLERTKEAYGMVYTPNGVEMFQGWKSQQTTTLSEVIGDLTACRRGDRRTEFLCDTIHRDYLIEMVFESSGSPRPPKARIDFKKEGF